jgi:hypothetical protein
VVRRRRLSLALAAILSAFAAGGAFACGEDTPSPRASPPSPATIFVDAIQRLESYPIPAYVVTNATWVVHGEYGDQEYAWRFATRSSDGMENASAYPIAKTLPVNAGIFPEKVGPLAWALRPNGGSSAPLRAHAMPPDVPDLKTIASVVAYRPDYKIELVGVERDRRGHDAYHLRLRPYGDALKHNLREMWVDVATSDLWRATFVGACGPCSGPTEITSWFGPVSGAWVVERYTFLSRCGETMVDPATCEFDLQSNAIVFLPDLPDWLFDEAAYREHAKAREPDYLAQYIAHP